MDLKNIDVAAVVAERQSQLEREWLGHELNRRTAEANQSLTDEEREEQVKAATDAQATIDAAYEAATEVANAQAQDPLDG